jgi:hypothetical protein
MHWWLAGWKYWDVGRATWHSGRNMVCMHCSSWYYFSCCTSFTCLWEQVCTFLPWFLTDTGHFPLLLCQQICRSPCLRNCILNLVSTFTYNLSFLPTINNSLVYFCKPLLASRALPVCWSRGARSNSLTTTGTVFSCCRFSCCWSLGCPLFAGHELERLKSERTKVASRDGLKVDDWWSMWDLNFNVASPLWSSASCTYMQPSFWWHWIHLHLDAPSMTHQKFLFQKHDFPPSQPSRAS